METTAPTSGRHQRRTITVLAVTLLAVIASVVGVATSSNTAEAATVRQGARWDHVDVLFTRSETTAIASGIVGGATACRWVIGAAGTAGFKVGGVLAGVVSAFVAGSVCVAAVTSCAAQANRINRSAGMTLSPAWFGIRYWCWSY